MKTAAYTICKNEIKKVEQWLYYTRDFDYRVVLDTGSTDGTYEALKSAGNVIVEQKSFTPWKFNVARMYNLDMVPDDVDWCLSPDMDEYFSINVLDEMEKTIKNNPNVTNIACDRLDIYSKVVRIGPPNLQPTNKIHRRHDYIWRSPIYEHLWFKHTDRNEVEIYNDDIYLIHDQDITKPRSIQYISMLKEQYIEDATDTWCSWYLLDYYFKEMDLENYVTVGMDFLEHHHYDERLTQVYQILLNIYNTQPTAQKDELQVVLMRNASKVRANVQI